MRPWESARPAETRGADTHDRMDHLEQSRSPEGYRSVNVPMHASAERGRGAAVVSRIFCKIGSWWRWWALVGNAQRCPQGDRVLIPSFRRSRRLVDFRCL